MRKRAISWAGSLLAAGLLLNLAGCGEWEKMAASRTLDARDKAVTAQDIGAYSFLIDDDYHDDRGRNKVRLVAEMLDLFDRFEKSEMHSFDRACRLTDDAHALCEQSYRLRVFADGQWRKIVQREQLELIRTDSGWKISSGL